MTTNQHVVCIVDATPGITSADVASIFAACQLPPPLPPYVVCNGAAEVVLSVEVPDA